MPEIEETCIFEVKADQAELQTKTNGDQLRLTGLFLTKEQAASLAWLVNSGEDAILEIEVKVKGD